MKFSFCSIAFRKTKQPLSTIIAILAELGYEGVEIWGNHLADDGSDIAEVAASLREHNLVVPIISPYFNVTGSELAWTKSIEDAKRYLDYANALRAPLLRVFTGILGSDEVIGDDWKIAVDRLRELSKLAAKQDVGLALETHPKTLVDNVPSIHRLIADIGQPNVYLNLDIYHLWEVHQDPCWIWTEVKQYVKHIHAKNALIPPRQHDKYPLFHDKQGLQEIHGIQYLEDGNMDYAPFFSCLLKNGFKEWLSIEWFGERPLEAAAHELEWLKEASAL